MFKYILIASLCAFAIPFHAQTSTTAAAAPATSSPFVGLWCTGYTKIGDGGSVELTITDVSGTKANGRYVWKGIGPSDVPIVAEIKGDMLTFSPKPHLKYELTLKGDTLTGRASFSSSKDAFVTFKRSGC